MWLLCLFIYGVVVAGGHVSAMAWIGKPILAFHHVESNSGQQAWQGTSGPDESSSRASTRLSDTKETFLSK